MKVCEGGGHDGTENTAAHTAKGTVVYKGGRDQVEVDDRARQGGTRRNNGSMHSVRYSIGRRRWWTSASR